MQINLSPEIISIIVAGITVAIASQVMLIPYNNFKNFFQLVNGVPFSNIDRDEYESAVYLFLATEPKKNPNSYVMSDYATSYIFRGMTGMNTSANRHPEMTAQEWRVMQSDIKNLFQQRVNDTSFENLNKIANEVEASHVYLILSKRTCWWLTQNEVLTIRYLPLPMDYTFEAYCAHVANKFESSTAFHLIYKNPGVRIYEYFNPKPVD